MFMNTFLANNASCTGGRRIAAFMLAVAANVTHPLLVNADDYQFIIAGDPVTAATAAASHYGCSGGESLSARPFAYRESDGGYLYSTEYRGFIMVFK